MLLDNTYLFPGQQPNEKIFLVTRQHWIVIGVKVLIWFCFLLIALVADWGIDNYLPILNTEPYAGFISLIGSLYYLALVLGLLIIWTMYYLNMQIVTNERIVDITQFSLLHRHISELHLSRIEDVTAEVHGIFQTFLDYGNVYVQTAGETGRFEFDRVPNPTYLNKLILDLFEQLPMESRMKKELSQK